MDIAVHRSCHRLTRATCASVSSAAKPLLENRPPEALNGVKQGLTAHVKGLAQSRHFSNC